MAGKQQQKKKQTSKTKKPSHQAYTVRDRHPGQVLRHIIRSSGFAKAEMYAREYGLEKYFDRLQYLDGRKSKQPHLVGRALSRHMKRLRMKQLEKKKIQERVQQAHEDGDA